MFAGQCAEVGAVVAGAGGVAHAQLLRRATLTQSDPTTATRWVIAIASHDQSEGTAYDARLGTYALAAYREADR